MEYYRIEGTFWSEPSRARVGTVAMGGMATKYIQLVARPVRRVQSFAFRSLYHLFAIDRIKGNRKWSSNIGRLSLWRK